MKELNQILEKEKGSEQKIAELKTKVQKEVERRESELKSLLEQKSNLSQEDLGKVRAAKDKKMQAVGESIQQKIAQEIAGLEQQGEENFEKAVQCIVDFLTG